MHKIQVQNRKGDVIGTLMLEEEEAQRFGALLLNGRRLDMSWEFWKGAKHKEVPDGTIRSLKLMSDIEWPICKSPKMKYCITIPCQMGYCTLGPSCPCCQWDGMELTEAEWPTKHEGCHCYKIKI